MNTEKIEKLKKSLSNPKIPADLKPKIESEIKRLEDLDSKNSTPKEEKKEEDKPVTSKTTPRKPRAKKPVAPKPSVRKPSETSKPKRTPMSLAKEIRKQGESWSDARARASKMMKEGSKEVTKTVETELDKLSKLVKRKKELRSQVGRTNLLIDSKRKAKPMGKRISKDGNVYYENRANRTDRGTYGKYHLAEGGYLTDPNFGNFQNQVLAGGGGVKPTLKKGDNVVVIGKRWFDRANGNTYHTAMVLVNGQSLGKSSMTYGYEEAYLQTAKEILLQYYNLPKGMKETSPLWQLREYGVTLTKTVSDGLKRDLATGGSVTNERKHVNHNEDYEVRYAKPRPTRKGYKGGRNFSNGGLITDTANAIFNPNEKKGKIQTLFGDKTKEGLLAMMTNVNYHPEEITSAIFIPNAKKGRIITEWGSKTKDGLLEMIKNMRNTFELGGTVVTDLAGHTGGSLGGDPTLLSGTSGTAYTGLVGETGAMSSGEMFMAGGTLPYGAEQPYMVTESFGNPAQHLAKGGGVRTVGNREYSYGRNWTNDHRHVNKGEDHEVNYNRKGKFLGVFNEGGFMSGGEGYAGQSVILTNTKTPIRQRFIGTELVLQDKQPNGSWSATVRKTGEKVPFDVYAEDFEQYQNGGSVTNERKHVNHDEDYEVRYAKPRPTRKGYKGARKFMAGGSMETPRIYVADLEAYNNGRLVGEWLDLADYNDADELMEAIQDVLKKSGGEQYAIHDAEYIPRSMYSEYMGQRDFEELYEMMDLAKDNDLPLEVVQEIVSQYDSSAINEFQGKYDSADDFAQQLVDDLGGIQNFNNFERYLTISETDRRLLAQEMADSYVDDIRDEDGGNRLISEAGMDVDEYEGADEDTQEEMLNNAREIVYDEYYDTWYDGLNDPYYFLVEEQGMYSAEDFANANFVQVDYEDLGDALEDDYTYIFYDSDLYVFNIR
jgi:antirestriction protein